MSQFKKVFALFTFVFLFGSCCAEIPRPLGDGIVSDDDNDATDDDDSTEEPCEDCCPPGMVSVLGNELELGEWDPEIVADFNGHEIIAKQNFTIDSFCIDDYAFPGAVGEYWPQDGLSLEDTIAFETVIEQYGRRLCSVTELLYAAAGPGNWRFPYDLESRQTGFCEPDDLWLEIRIGAYPDCVSQLGVHDFLVRSTWARLENESIRATCQASWESIMSPDTPFPEGGQYAVWGGTSRQDTFYAPSNYGLHFHTREYEGGDFLDDGVRTCADPDTWTPEREAAWQELITEFLETNTFAGFLN